MNHAQASNELRDTALHTTTFALRLFSRFTKIEHELLLDRALLSFRNALDVFYRPADCLRTMQFEHLVACVLDILLGASAILALKLDRA